MQQSLTVYVVVLAVVAAAALLVFALGRLLRALGIKANRADRMSNSLTEIEKLVRPSATHVQQAKRERERRDDQADPGDDDAEHGLEP